MIKINTLLSGLFLFLVSCQKDINYSPTPFHLQIPSYFPKVTYPLEKNVLTEEGIKLGKKLFHEPLLSIDHSIACSNCHVKGAAFSDPQHNPSIGVFERVGTRNAPSIANMAFRKDFLWDGGVAHLDFIPPFAIENPREMDQTLSAVIQKLNSQKLYAEMFQNAFPDTDTISSPLLLKALSQYMLTLISSRSKYDQVLQGKAQFSPEEIAGKTLFEKKCSSCHTGSLFTNDQFMNNGLDSAFKDAGRMIISEDETDLGKFRVPSLRNIALTAPYMHDGRFRTLEEVLEHYRSGVKTSTSLALQLGKENRPGIIITVEEKASILAFLNTLTDYEFISDPKH